MTDLEECYAIEKHENIIKQLSEIRIRTNATDNQNFKNFILNHLNGVQNIDKLDGSLKFIKKKLKDFTEENNFYHLVHYDLSPSNILVDFDNNIKYFIDWDGYVIGDSMYSISKYHYYCHSKGLKVYPNWEFLPVNERKNAILFALIVSYEKITLGLSSKSNRRLNNDIDYFKSNLDLI